MAVTSEILTEMEDQDDILSNLDISATATTSQTRAIRSLNRAQDLMERFISEKRNLLVTVDDSINQTVGQEYTALPLRTQRIDSVWFLNASNSLPTYEIDAIRTPGGHRQQTPWPLFDVSTNSTGKPRGYWWSHGNDRLYWDRQPDTTNSIRVVGFFGAADITLTPDSTFAYSDAFIRPLASVASEVFRLRRRDDWGELQQFANRYFQPVVDQMSLAWRHQDGELRGSFPSY